MKFHDTKLLNIISSKTKRKMAVFLLTHTASMNGREIASILKIPTMTANRTMRQFAELNFVNFTVIGRSHLWKVNRKSYAYKIFSRLDENNLIISSPLENLKQTLLKHIPKNLIKKMILFGSIAKEQETINSDIDIFILTKDTTAKTKLEPYIEELITVCLETYGNRLAPYLLTEQELKKKKDLPIINAINAGVELFPQRKDGK